MAGKTDPHAIVVENIRRLMYDQHMSQTTLAARAPMQRSAVSMILNGADFRLSTLAKIAGALGVEPFTLLMPHSAQPVQADAHKLSVVEAIATLLEQAKGGK